MKKFSVLLTTFVFSFIQLVPAFAQNTQTVPSEPQAPTYQPVKVAGGLPAYVIDGKDLFVPGSTYRIMYKDLIKAEGGKYLQVPADYRDPNGKKLSIYYTSAAPFDPSKPTVIYVSGGPGQAIHDSVASFRESAIKAGVNIILFDPRGIALSSPESPADYENFEIWGAKKIAQDMVAIANDLKLDKVSVNGISFGTVPASLFATMFPERTRSVILEGVMAKDLPLHQQSVRYARLLNNRVLPRLNRAGRVLLAGIYPKLQEKLSDSNYLLGSYSADLIAVYVNSLLAILPTLKRLNLRIDPTEIYPSVEEAFISLLFHNLTGLSETEVTGVIHSEKITLRIANYVLSELLKNRENEAPVDLGSRTSVPKLTDSENEVRQPRIKMVPVNDLSMDENMFRNVTTINLTDRFRNRIDFDVLNGFQSTVAPALPSEEAYALLAEFRVELDETLYDAKNLSIQAPTYYFEGTGDHATEFAGASYHYKNAPKGDAYFFAFKNAGHNPLQYLIKSNPDAGLKLYKQAVLGERPSTSEISKIRNNLFPLAYTDKAGNGVSASGVVLKNRCENAFAQ